MPGVFWVGVRAELTEVAGTGKLWYRVRTDTLPECWAGMSRPYRTLPNTSAMHFRTSQYARFWFRTHPLEYLVHLNVLVVVDGSQGRACRASEVLEFPPLLSSVLNLKLIPKLLSGTLSPKRGCSSEGSSRLFCFFVPFFVLRLCCFYIRVHFSFRVFFVLCFIVFRLCLRFRFRFCSRFLFSFLFPISFFVLCSRFRFRFRFCFCSRFCFRFRFSFFFSFSAVLFCLFPAVIWSWLPSLYLMAALDLPMMFTASSREGELFLVSSFFFEGCV